MNQPATQEPTPQPMPLVTLSRDQQFQLAFEPRDFDGAWKMAGIAASINLCGVKSIEEGFIRIAAGRELGLTTFQSLRLVYVMKGRPALDASLMLSLCLNHPKCEYFDLVSTDGTKAVFKAKRVGRDEVVLEWTIAQAEQAGLLAKGKDSDNADKSSWHTYPEAMLRARCIAALARIVFPDALNGLYAREELVGDDVVGPAVHVAVTASPVSVATAAQTVVDAKPEPPSTPGPTSAKPTPAPATTPMPQVQQRDFAQEADGIKQAIVDAKSDDERRAVRDQIKTFAKDGGAPYVDELKRLYELTHVPSSTGGAS